MDQNERAKWLKEFLASEEFSGLVVPTLRSRMVEMEQRAMRATAWEDVRVYQGAWQVLRRMLEDPKGFFEEKESELG